MPELLEGSRYAKYLPKWLDKFGRDRVLILLQEDIGRDPRSAVSQIESFLDIRELPLRKYAGRKVNAASMPRSIWLAGLATKVAGAARARGWHRLVSTGKTLGLMSVYRGGGIPPSLDERTRQDLIRQFEEDITYTEEILGREIPMWRNPGEGTDASQ